jgi:hypothetical protein
MKTVRGLTPQTPPLTLDLELDKLPTQTDFMLNWHQPFRAYGGGYANGKTSAGVYCAIYLSYLIPGNRGFIGRFDGKELRQSTMAEFRRLCPASMIERHNEQSGYIKFKAQYGGSEIIYGDMKEDMRGPNLGWFYIDQAEEVDEDKFLALLGRLRKKSPWPMADGGVTLAPDGTPWVAPTYGLVTFNPEGRNWVWKYFHEQSPDHQPDYHLYMASTFDGQAAGFISKEYVERMLRVYPEAARKRYLDGSWDIFEGRVYPMFDRDDHVLARIDRQPTWLLYESIDHGLRNHTAVGWWALDHAGNIYLLDEHYEAEKPVAYHAACIKAKREALGQVIAVTYLDAHCWSLDQSRDKHLYSIADEYRDHGIYAVPGQKDWNAAYNRICEHLALDPDHPHPITGQHGAPRLYVAAHCRRFIEEILAYTWKRRRGTLNRNQPDEPVDHNDHHMDELAYFIVSRPSQPTLETRTLSDPIAAYRRAIAQRNPLRADPPTASSWMSV